MSKGRIDTTHQNIILGYPLSFQYFLGSFLRRNTAAGAKNKCRKNGASSLNATDCFARWLSVSLPA
jgi:hypothetical protein